MAGSMRPWKSLMPSRLMVTGSAAEAEDPEATPESVAPRARTVEPMSTRVRARDRLSMETGGSFREPRAERSDPVIEVSDGSGARHPNLTNLFGRQRAGNRYVNDRWRVGSQVARRVERCRQTSRKNSYPDHSVIATATASTASEA